MSFEKFVPPKKLKEVVKPPSAKMLKGGQISLNHSAYLQYLKGSSYVELYYDAAAKKVGLKPKKYGTKIAFKIKSVGKGKATYRINAKPLIEYYGIKLSGKTDLSLDWNAKDELLELSF